jgi:hypothetical protein
LRMLLPLLRAITGSPEVPRFALLSLIELGELLLFRSRIGCDMLMNALVEACLLELVSSVDNDD